MEKLWKILIIVLVWSNLLYSQRNVALLHTPVRPLPEEIVIANKLVSMPFQLERGMIYVKAKLEGQTGDFILDTGAPGLIINEYPQVSSSEYTAQSCSQQVTIGSKSVKTFFWAQRTLHNVEAITLDLSHLDRLNSANLTGMIGYELLKNRILFLDYQRQQLLLLNDWVEIATESPLARIPFTLDQHLPVIEVQIGEETLRLGIDTGAATNLLDRERAASLSGLLTLESSEELQGLDQSIQRVAAARLEGLSFERFRFSTKFLLLDLTHLKGDKEQVLHGLLGYQFLSNYRVAIDYRNQEILLWPLKEKV